MVEGDDPAVLVHDPKNRGVAAMLIEMPAQGFPVALGVIYEDPAPTFESVVVEQNAAAAAGKAPDLQALVSKGQTWQVEKEPHTLRFISLRGGQRRRVLALEPLRRLRLPECNITIRWPAGRSARRGSRRKRARGSRR